MSERRPVAEDTEGLIGLLHEVSEGLTRLAADMADAAGSHPTDMHAVSVISRHDDDPLTVGALGEHVGLSPAASTALVDRLEARGHVRRVRDERDRRRVHLHATELAHATSMSVLEGFLGVLRSRLEHYDEHELAVAQRFLEDVRVALAHRRG